MAVYNDREAFIPYRRSDLIDLCISDGQLSVDQQGTFREFCNILSAYYHFQFHSYLETIKYNFEPFNPDSITKVVHQPDPMELQQMEEKLVVAVIEVLERANYIPLSQESLQRAFKVKSLIDLKTDIDFNEFEQLVCYYRGDDIQTIKTKRWFWHKEIQLDILKQIFVLLRFKDATYFEDKNVDIKTLKFIPGKAYIYYYQNVPKPDLEFLFPNIKASMTWKDRLLLVVPAIGAAIPLLLKIAPQILLIIGAIAFLTLGQPLDIAALRADEESVKDLAPLLLAILSLLIALGGFTFQQYTKYQSKKIKFQKEVTDTLFFRNIASNISALSTLIDFAEEEETKEILLVYYHLLTSDRPLTPQELDDHIEKWMDEKLGTKIDFDIQGPLNNLAKIRGDFTQADHLVKDQPLLSFDNQHRCRLLPLNQAKQVIDYVWDNAFLFSHGN
ncbi:MAG: DUF3754 domain-containing protein [Symploca sp. SIO2C1]|nr:DUF3754 domain-containing protein [Symploca sp. SIO2C1]